MEQPSPAPLLPPLQTSSTSVMDLEVDALAHCANYLDLKDVSNMAMTCKFFKSVAYSDSVWRRLFREHWPELGSSIFLRTSYVRDAYLARHIALEQLKFVDPSYSAQWSLPAAKPHQHILLDKNDVILSQGSTIIKINFFSYGSDSVVNMRDHNARITCMRLFSLSETSLFRNEAENKDNVLVTSSCDHSVRLWWKGRCYRSFRGHNGPVTTIADKLLGNCSSPSGKLFASGGEDGTVRLWSLSPSGKRGQHALRTTFYGHEKPIALLSVAGHKTSLLVSASRDAKIKVWDTAASSLARSSGCVGMCSVLGAPLGIKCHESLCYVAAGSSVTAIDLRTMQKAFTAVIHQPKLFSFEMLPSKSLICTGGNDKAMLWDVRKSQDKPEPVAELEGHTGPITCLHMDPYKVVTGTPKDSYCNVWETNTGTLANSLPICIPDEPEFEVGCSAMAVRDCRIVTASCGQESGLVYMRDFTNAIHPVSSHDDNPHTSKFWEPQVHSDASDS